MDAVVGIDAHRRTHTLVVVDRAGRRLAHKTIGTNSDSHLSAIRWAQARFGRNLLWGIEDCRALTVRLERDLLGADQVVLRVAPHLMSRSRNSARTVGKSDPIDALAVARAVLREPDLPIARHNQQSMDLRLLIDRREDLIRLRVAIGNRLLNRVHQLDPTWSQPRNWDAKTRRDELEAWLHLHDDCLLGQLGLDELSEIKVLTASATAIAAEVGKRIRSVAPDLLTIQGCGELTAAKIVAEVADIRRFKSEAAFARYVGVAPVPHWSGSTVGSTRHMRHGNRQLNAALHRIAVVQLSKNSRGRAYFQMRIARGDNSQKALRALKRRLARVVFTRMRREQPASLAPCAT